MPSYIRKNKLEILRGALDKLQKTTSITAVSPGSVARALVETITNEIGDFYDIMDFNLNQSLVTTASGGALDLIGSLYGVTRKQVNDLAAIESIAGSFYFYIENPVLSEVRIPSGTNVFADMSFIGKRFSYSVGGDIIILPGRTKAYANIVPNFNDDSYTAGANTLILHDAVSPAGVTILCTNPKPIAARPSFESDEAYRARVIKSIRVTTSGTAEAVRFAGLSTTGVRDVRIRQLSTGMGTFEAVVITENSQTRNTVLSNCIANMELVRPIGVRMNVVTPTTLPVDVTIQIITPVVTSSTMMDMVAGRVQVGIQKYINSLLPDDMVVYNKILQSVFDSSDLIKDVIVKKFAVNGIEVLRRNYQPDTNQQLIPASINVEIATA